MTLGAVTFKNFTVFEDATFDLCPGINVLIGANATGKTHAMKAMYAAVWSASMDQRLRTSALVKFGDVFLPDRKDVRRLIRSGASAVRRDATIELVTAEGTHLELDIRGGETEAMGSHDEGVELEALYVPSREVFSMYEGFIPAYRNRELAFDETFFDLCVALNANVLRGERAEQVAPLVHRLETMVGGRVLLEGNRFYVQPSGGERVEAHLVAEGLRKIATITRLVANGSIAPGGVLFWDEPETNLNPRLIKQVVDVLVELARHSVQVVLATHDYLLSHRLSLLAEYGRVPPGSVRFFSLARREPDGPVQVAHGGVLAELPENSIVDEFVRHYDFERELFDSSHGG